MMEEVNFKRIVIGIFFVIIALFLFQYPLEAAIIALAAGLIYWKLKRGTSQTETIDKKVRVPISPRTKEDVLNRGADACQMCGRIGKEIHHIDHDPSNNHIDNLVLLCPTCHDEADRGHPSQERLRQIAQRPFVRYAQ